MTYEDRRVRDSALAQQLARRVAQHYGKDDARRSSFDTPRLADLVLLLNPADESIYAKRICDLLSQASPDQFRTQIPAMVSLCSMTDMATQRVMPAADTVGSLTAAERDGQMPYLDGNFQGRWQRQFELRSPPNNPFLHNGDVELSAGSQRKPQYPEGARHPNVEFGEAVTTLNTNLSESAIPGQPLTVHAAYQRVFAIRLAPDPANRTQYWALRVSSGLMDGHSDIWSADACSLYARLFRLSVPDAFQRGVRGSSKWK